jgi:hypothetical protein
LSAVRHDFFADLKSVPKPLGLRSPLRADRIIPSVGSVWRIVREVTLATDGKITDPFGDYFFGVFSMKKSAPWAISDGGVYFAMRVDGASVTDNNIVVDNGMWADIDVCAYLDQRRNYGRRVNHLVRSLIDSSCD